MSVLLLFHQIFRDTGIFEQTNLSDLHQSLETDKGRFLVLFQPNIKHADGYSRYGMYNHNGQYSLFCSLTALISESYESILKQCQNNE